MLLNDAVLTDPPPQLYSYILSYVMVICPFHHVQLVVRLSFSAVIDKYGY